MATPALPPLRWCCLHSRRENPAEMGAVIEAAGEGDVSNRSVGRGRCHQEICGMIHTLLEYRLHDGLATLCEQAMEEAGRDPEIARNALRSQVRIAEAEPDHLAGTYEEGFPQGIRWRGRG